jgi:hypothetical protein
MPSLDLTLVRVNEDPNRLWYQLKDRLGELERGSKWEPIKNLLEGDGHSNKTNTATKHVSDSTTQVDQDHVAAGVLLVLGTNTQPSEQKLTNTHSENLHGLLLVLHRSDRWPTPVRPVDSAGHAGGYNSHTSNVPGSLSDSSRPWNKNHLRNTTCKEEETFTKPSKTTPNIPRTDQQDHGTKPHEHNNSPRPNSLGACIGQTGQEHQSHRSRLGSLGWTTPTGQLPQIQLLISRITPQICARLWG